MPEDKDFKKLVRARMEQTGECYTQALAQLRPETAAVSASAAAAPGGALGSILPTDVDSLIERRAERARLCAELTAARGSEFPTRVFDPPAGPPWELRVVAGGPLEEIGAPSLRMVDVAALGAALPGVGFATFGLDLKVRAPAGTVSLLPAPLAGWLPSHGSGEPMLRAQAELLTLVRERAGLAVPPWEDGRVCHGHRSRITGDGVGAPWLVALTQTDVLIRPGDDSVVDLAALREGEAALCARVWAGYGVSVNLDREFPEHRVASRLEGSPSFSWPEIDRSFWGAAGEAVTAAAHEAGLPSLPLWRGWLEGRTGGSGIYYRAKWGHFHR
jgi:hypothetical protein